MALASDEMTHLFIDCDAGVDDAQGEAEIALFEYSIFNVCGT